MKLACFGAASALLLFPLPAGATISPCHEITDQILESISVPLSYSVYQGPQTPNTYIASIVLDESSDQAQAIFRSPFYMSRVSQHLIVSCGYTTVEFYGAPFENGKPQPVDNFVLPGSFTVLNGQMQQRGVCLNLSGQMAYCN